MTETATLCFDVQTSPKAVAGTVFVYPTVFRQKTHRIKQISVLLLCPSSFLADLKGVRQVPCTIRRTYLSSLASGMFHGPE